MNEKSIDIIFFILGIMAGLVIYAIFTTLI